MNEAPSVVATPASYAEKGDSSSLTGITHANEAFKDGQKAFDEHIIKGP